VVHSIIVKRVLVVVTETTRIGCAFKKSRSRDSRSILETSQLDKRLRSWKCVRVCFFDPVILVLPRNANKLSNTTTMSQLPPLKDATQPILRLVYVREEPTDIQSRHHRQLQHHKRSKVVEGFGVFVPTRSCWRLFHKRIPECEQARTRKFESRSTTTEPSFKQSKDSLRTFSAHILNN
jgi:hypothetical protein